MEGRTCNSRNGFSEATLIDRGLDTTLPFSDSERVVLTSCSGDPEGLWFLTQTGSVDSKIKRAKARDCARRRFDGVR